MGRQLGNSKLESKEDNIYTNLKALGVNIDAIREFSPTLNQLEQFYGGILALFERSER
jgi:hypothetical protein